MYNFLLTVTYICLFNGVELCFFSLYNYLEERSVRFNIDVIESPEHSI